MRHAVSGNKLGRNSSWRKATVRDIAKATLIRQRICTTKAKAKEARKLVDRLITLGKKGTLAHRRKAFSILNDHQLVSQLFNKTAPRFQKRKGGYTRIIPLSFRRGDNAQLVYLELTEKEIVIISKPKSSAVAKPQQTGTSTEKQKSAEVSADSKEKKEVSKAEPNKDPSRKYKPAPGKGKPGKNIVGGIKKMFRRKTAE